MFSSIKKNFETSYNKIKNYFLKDLSAPQIIIYSFLLVNILGTILLMLPLSSTDNISVNFIDALFTSTSAICVTGLSIFTTYDQWTIFGQIIILILIQIGGIGFITILTMMFVFLGKKITLKERILIQQSLNQNDLKGMVKLVKNVFLGTIIVESIAAVILTFRFFLVGNYKFIDSIGLGIFQSVSAFCNAGFDNLGDTSLVEYMIDPVVNIVIISLIILGGLGYTVWIDIINVIKTTTKNNLTLKCFHNRLSLHTKIVLDMSLILIFLGTVFFIIIEYNNQNTIGNLSFLNKILASLFQSVTTRTAGFFTIPQNNFNLSSKFMSIILMFIGGSPVGTAGGVKTVTIAVIIASVISVIKGKSTIITHEKSINFSNLQKALSVIILNFSLVIISTMILSITEDNLNTDNNFMTLLFETTSATGTTGLSLGLTSKLSSIGKFVIVICMFIGRIGPITTVLALSSRKNKLDKNLYYPEEKIFIG